MIKGKKGISLLIAMLMMISVIAPNLAIAEGNDASGGITVIGSPEEASLTIYKYSQDSAGEDGEIENPADSDQKGTPLEGVEFTLTLKETFDPAEDEWKVADKQTELVGTTDSEGKIVFNKESDPALVLGRYEVKETDGPADVILNPGTFQVDVPMTNEDRTTLNYNVEIYPKNQVIRADGEMIKKGDDGKPLAGVNFNLFKYSDDSIEHIKSLKTDADGKIKLENLPAGKYFFQESSTVGEYALNTSKVEFRVVKGIKDDDNFEEDSSGQDIEYIWVEGDINTGNVVRNYVKPTIEKDVEEKKKHEVDRGTEYSYNIKVTTPEDIKSYKAIGVTDTLDDRLQYAGEWTATGAGEDNIQFTQRGQQLIWEVIDLDKLTPGTPIEINFTARIREDAELGENEDGIPNTAELHFSNGKGSYTDPIDPYDPVNPYDPYDPVDPTDPKDPEDPRPVDPEDPETPVDPEDPEYPKPEDPPKTPPVIVIPTEGGFKIIKIDKKSKETLKGAEFKLTSDKAGDNVIDATGTVIKVNGVAHEGKLENLVTGDDGVILIDGLTPGDYYLHETKAPKYMDDNVEKPYRILTKPVKVEVKNSTEAAEVKVENSKSGWNLPTTGGIGTILFTLIGITFMAAAAFLLKKNKKESQN